MLDQSNVSTRLPAQDLNRARRFYSEPTVAKLRSRGLVFEEYDLPGLKTIDGIATISGNYPSKGRGEKGAWFKDSEGNILAIGQPLR